MSTEQFLQRYGWFHHLRNQGRTESTNQDVQNLEGKEQYRHVAWTQRDSQWYVAKFSSIKVWKKKIASIIHKGIKKYFFMVMTVHHNELSSRPASNAE